MRSQIIKFFEENIELIEGCDGGGLDILLPPFALKPKDFLLFAERDLAGKLDHHKLINATSNLKRAMDCELDTLMFVLGLDDYYRKKRLGVEKKLGFLRISGIFKANSLDRLNTLRNRLEHHYEIPTIEDVHVYYDLVTAFISIGDSFLHKLRSIGTVDLMYVDSNFKNAAWSSMDFSIPKIELYLTSDKLNHHFSIDLKNDFTVDKLKNFSYLLKVNQLIGDFYYDSITNDDFINSLKIEI